MKDKIKIIWNTGEPMAGDAKLTAIIARYGQVSNSMDGDVKYLPGSIQFPDDLNEIKLWLDHYTEPIGYLDEIKNDGDDIIGTFIVPSWRKEWDLDDILSKAENKVKDAVSISTMANEGNYIDDIFEVTSCRAAEVSIVKIPATSGCKIIEIVRNEKKMPEITPPVKEKVAETTPPASEPEPAIIKQEGLPNIRNKNRTETVENESLDTIVNRIRNGYINNGMGGVLLEASTIQKNAISFIRNAGLTDLKISELNPVRVAPQWVGELKTLADKYRPRLFIENFPQKRIKSLTVTGYKVVQRAEVGEWKFDKTDIPTGPVKYETATEKAKGWAGGWDVDQAEIDLGDPDIIRETLMQARISYNEQTDKAGLTAAITAATEITSDGKDPMDVLADLAAQAASDKSDMKVFHIGSQFFNYMLRLKDAEVLWWLKKTGKIFFRNGGRATGEDLAFVYNPDMPSNTAIICDSIAADNYEKEPYDLQALNIAKGGRDIGLFGYDNFFIKDPKAMHKAVLSEEQANFRFDWSNLNPAQGENVTLDIEASK